MPTLTRTTTPYAKVKVRHITRGDLVDGRVTDTVDVAEWSAQAGENGVWEIEVPAVAAPDCLVVDETPRGGRARQWIVRAPASDTPTQIASLPAVTPVPTDAPPAAGDRLPTLAAPSDGTHTYVTPVDGVLPLVLVQPSTNGATEDGRAHIILPDPADHLGEKVTIKTLFAPTLIPNRLGATIGALSTTPGVLGDLATWVASNPPLNWASSPLTLEITVNGTPYEVVLDEDYLAAGLIGQAITMQLILAGAPVVLVDFWHLTTDDAEPSTDAGDVLTLALVTATQGAGSSIEITDAGVGDPLGLWAETTSYPGADTGRILWGVDRSLLMAGHGNTHHCADGNTDPGANNVAAHQAVTLVAVADAMGAYWGGLGESIRSEFVTYAPLSEFFDEDVKNVKQALDDLGDRP